MEVRVAFLFRLLLVVVLIVVEKEELDGEARDVLRVEVPGGQCEL